MTLTLSMLGLALGLILCLLAGALVARMCREKPLLQKIILTLALMFTLCFTLLLGVIFCRLMAGGPAGNHFTSAFALAPFVWVGALSALLVGVFVSARTGWGLCAWYVFLAALIVSGDYFNCILEYGEWLRRGMPEPFTVTEYRKYKLDSYWLPGLMGKYFKL